MERVDTAPSSRIDADAWRLGAIALVVAAIILIPFFLLLWIENETRAANRLTAHTRDVSEAAYTLSYDIRSLESASLALAFGVDNPLVRDRIATGLRTIPTELERVTLLTAENPIQQRHLGALETVVEERLKLASAIRSASPSERQRMATEIVTRFPVRNAVSDFLKTESELLDARRKRLLALETLQTRTATIAALLQFALLLGLLVMAWRSTRQRLQSERRAQEASARALAVLQNIREPVVVVDAAQRIVLHNPAFVETFAARHGVTPGMALDAVGGGVFSNAEFLQRLNDLIVRQRELWDFDLRVQQDDDARQLLINARSIVLPGMQDRVALVSMVDITARKLAEAEILALNRQLEGKVEQVSDVNRELEAFSYSVSHDLRAPLRHIGGFSDKLARHLGDTADEKSLHYLKTISDSAQRMAQLIDDLLVYSRLGRSAMRLQRVDLQSLVDEVRALLDANSASEHPEHRIQWHIDPLPSVVGDENMLRQAWLNLLGNAVKYSGKREPAIIHVEHRRRDDGNHAFSVRDNGVGFDMAYAHRLFGVFQRLHKASEYPGTGIGLASVRRALMRHGGQIEAASVPGEGSTFTFTLPESADNAATP